MNAAAYCAVTFYDVITIRFMPYVSSLEVTLLDPPQKYKGNTLQLTCVDGGLQDSMRRGAPLPGSSICPG